MKYQGNNGEEFEIDQVDGSNCDLLKLYASDTLRLLWFTSDGNKLTIDGVPFTFNTNEIVCLTQFHKVEVICVTSVNLLRFNRPFYCILDHDSEVGCKGILYYGAAKLPVLHADSEEVDILSTAWKMATFEFERKDNLQLEMLQMMLKRILILCTRIYKRQAHFSELQDQESNMVREFNYLIEKHFKTKHSVKEYADLLFKSPKTVANVFKLLGEKTPLQFIQERLTLEARRLLKYSDKDVTQIAYEIGFNDVQSFSRFFKKQEGVSPTEYRAE